jgi:hypothetical protein
VIDLLERVQWIRGEDEKAENFINRIRLQEQQFVNMKRSQGRCFMIKFGLDDIRPMWENQINIMDLKELIRTPLDTHWDCPLCQPYDAWTGLTDMDNNRRFLCRIVAPRYEGGCIDEEGTYSKCVCILKPKHRSRLKFKK